MAEKKPVYNGYEERYLSGLELKNLFINIIKVSKYGKS